MDEQRYFHREYRGRRRRKDLVSTVSIEEQYSFIVLELPIRYWRGVLGESWNISPIYFQHILFKIQSSKICYPLNSYDKTYFKRYRKINECN